VIFGAELARWAERLPGLRLSLCVEQADASWTGARGRFSAELLRELAPDFASLPAFLCGPAGFMQSVMQTYADASALGNVRFESFGGFDLSAFAQQAQLIRFLRSGTQRVSDQPRTILEEAEHLGLSIAFGCRAGNCGTCRCTKKRGVVVDVITGRESGDGEEAIFPCISVARGTVDIDL
jgi:ferredoxin